MKKLLTAPTRPFTVDPRADVRTVLEKMAGISFQGRNLASAFEVWRAMLADRVVIMLGLAGAMVPAGMRRIVTYLIEHRLIDVLVSTGANLFHDVHETLGLRHYLGSASVDDLKLREAHVDRIYDTFADEREFIRTDHFVSRFAERQLEARPYTTREFFYRLGVHLAPQADDGIVKAAARKGVPVYCPAIGDSSIGIALAESEHHGKGRVVFDVIGDVRETARLATAEPGSGVVYIGGGTPKNFVQQTEVTAPFLGLPCDGHRYAIQFTQDAPHWGGLSGCTFKEAQSWGKICSTARTAMVFADATLVLPLLVTGLAQARVRRPHVPRFGLDGPLTFGKSLRR